MIDITEHLNLAYKVTWNIYPKVRKKYEFEDLLQIAYIGLIKAGKNFDEHRGIQFSTYAFYTMKGEIIRHITDDKKFNISRNVPHNFVLCSYESERENGSLESRIGADGFEERFINNAVLNQAIKKLLDNEKRILKLHLIDDLTQREVSEICGVYQNQVSRTKRRIIKKLREVMEIDMNMKVSV